MNDESLTVMAEFKAHMLDRFIGIDEGEVTEYFGCELVRDRKARTGQLIQTRYAERVLRVFNMWMRARARAHTHTHTHLSIPPPPLLPPPPLCASPPPPPHPSRPPPPQMIPPLGELRQV